MSESLGNQKEAVNNNEGAKKAQEDSEMTSEISFGDRDEVLEPVDTSRRIKKLNVPDYLKKCKHDEDYLR